MRLRLVRAALILTLVALATFARAQFNANFGPQTFNATGSSIAIPLGSKIAFHQLTWVTTGSPVTATCALDSSVDGVSWTAGGLITSFSCSAASGNTAISVSTLANFARLTIVALSSGTVTLSYTGWVNNPVMGQLICVSSSLGAVTGNGTTLTVFNCPIPASLFGPGHAFRVKFGWTETGAISTAYGLVLGSTAIITSAGTAVTAYSSWEIFCVVNSANSETCMADNMIQNGATAIFLASTSGAAVAATETTNAPSSISLTMNAASGTVVPRLEFGQAY